MTLRTGAVLLIGLAAGMVLANALATAAHAKLITALQVVQCTKADKG